jgi:hypothetical protein
MGYDARQSTGVHDRIYHRIVAIDDGATVLYYFQRSLPVFAKSLRSGDAQPAKGAWNRSPKFLVERHASHSTPEVGPPGMYKVLLGRSNHEWDRRYADKVTSAILNGVREARSKIGSARIGFTTGISMANINRRAKDANGHVSLGLNSDGRVDRQIGIIRLEMPDGTPIAIIANYIIDSCSRLPGLQDRLESIWARVYRAR